MNKRWTIKEIKKFAENNSESTLLTTEYHGFRNLCCLNVHVAIISKRHLPSSKIKTSVNARFANRRKRHAKWIAEKQGTEFCSRKVDTTASDCLLKIVTSGM